MQSSLLKTNNRKHLARRKEKKGRKGKEREGRRKGKERRKEGGKGEEEGQKKSLHIRKMLGRQLSVHEKVDYK